MKLTTAFLTAASFLSTATAVALPSNFDLAARTVQAELEARAATGLNTSREYRLKTELKKSSASKTQFANLYVYSYHTGAGLGDAVLTPNKTIGIKGFLNMTAAIHGPKGRPYGNQEFDLGTEFPWEMIPEPDTVFYSMWQPVRINAGGAGATEYSGFFINGTGLQWTGEPKAGPDVEFGGWIVCDWWHPDISAPYGSAPQLFFRLPYESATNALPATCADVKLIPEYI